MSDYPFFGIWVKDFLGDNRVNSMTTEEVGAYFLLLLMAWQEDPAATLPHDEGLLARWARLDTPRWLACRERILACFTKGRDGRLTQKRLRKEWERLVSMSEKRSRAGKEGAKGRWQTHAIATDLPMAKTCDSGSESSEQKNELVRDGPVSQPALFDLPESLNTAAFRAALALWERYCGQKDNPLTPEGRKAFLKKVAAWGSARAVAAIEHTMAENWTGIREPDEKKQRGVQSEKAKTAAEEEKARVKRNIQECERAASPGGLFSAPTNGIHKTGNP